MAFEILADAVANAPAVGFQFLLARAARADSAGLPGKLFRASGEARQHVIQLRELDLQLPFAAARVARKNIQDQLRAVNHAAFGALFEVAQLRRRKIAVKHDQRRVVQMRFDFHFLDLAAPDHGGGIDLVAHLKNAAGNLRARAASQLRQLFERSALRFARIDPRHVRGPLQAHTYQEHAFVAFCRTCSLHSALSMETIRRRGACDDWFNFTLTLYTRPILGHLAWAPKLNSEVQAKKWG